ncbi:hypothetical protein DV451_003557 [Geotrichum candidum]|uniref:Helicase C-terminal domain-containing protein n=1 Tax=Geotrichum candidum TaxID=1173061 RepID=A0A9P5KTF7_GEOCN|nr:hypothetical protein DV451_003557 [Geotrichum candidum]
MDVARLKAILGGDELVFEHARMEDIDAMAAKKRKNNKKKGEMPSFDQSFAPDADKSDEEVLLVEFRDVKLRQTLSTGSGGSTSVRMPTVRRQDMVKAIERRVVRFRTALDQFIETHGGLTGPDIGVRRCWEDRLDVEATRLLPVPASETRPLDPVQAMLVKSENQMAMANAYDAAGGGENFNFAGYIDALKRDPSYQNQIVHGGEFTVPEQAPVYAETTTELLGDALQDALDRLLLDDADLDRGSHAQLYAHQADALKAVFKGYRRTCELLMKSVTAEFDRRYQKINAKRRMANGGEGDEEERHEPPNVMAYRGGYSVSDRRLIEHELFAGRLAGVVATNALELGIDIGALDAVLVVGFPMTVASLRQQAGRAGRRARASLAVLIGGGDPLDQHYMANPRLAIEDNEPDTLRLTADVAAEMPGLGDNEGVLEEHLQCAAFEIPVNIEADQSYFTSALSKEKAQHDLAVFQSIVETKLDCVNDTDVDGAATEPGDRYHTCDAKWLPMPARQVALRGSGGQLGTDENYSVIDIDSHVVLEEIEPARVSFTLYEGGVFIHQGCTYLVKSVEPDARYALVARRDGLSWITRQRDYTDVDPAKTLSVSSHEKLIQTGSPASAPLLAVVKYGLVAVATVVFGFFKLTTTTADGTGAYSKIIDAVELPESQTRPYSRTCAGFWIDLPYWLQELIARDKGLSLAGAIHAAEHAVLNALSSSSSSNYGTAGQAAPRLATECKAPEKEFKRAPSARRRPARLIFYDPEALDLAGGQEHRRATAWRAYAGLGPALSRALARMERCACTVGCPECGVTWGPCTENNIVVSKPGALVLLRYLNSPLAAHDPGAAAAPTSTTTTTTINTNTTTNTMEDLADLRKSLVLGVPDGPEENLAGHSIAQTII